MVTDIDQALEIIRRGTVEILLEEELIRKLERSISTGTPLRIKAGFDPTAPDIHLGHTVLLTKLRQFQELGHEVYFIIGDFTAMIGDPTGRSEVRKPLSREEVMQNAKTYQDQAFKILLPEKTHVVFNSTWLNSLTPTDIVKLASKYTVMRMFERDDFKGRVRKNQPIFIHEFLYPLFQAYDSVHLKADVELGGTDQKFNLALAREIMRAYDLEPQVILTMPLLEGTDGVKKMSKSYGNYIGITEPPDQIFGKIMSISDELMWRYYELLSSKPMSTINEWKARCSRGEMNPMDAKKALAFEMVERFYSVEDAEGAQRRFEQIFSRKSVPDDIETVEIAVPEGSSITLLQLIRRTGAAKSNSEARRLLSQGAVKIDGEKVTDECRTFCSGERFILRVGKKFIKKVCIV